jgi:cysteine desulfuration protein SufE
VFSADSDAIITKGIISMLISVYSGRTADEILSSDDTFIDRIGLRENLSPTRQNGLLSMLDTIRSLAKQEGLK